MKKTIKIIVTFITILLIVVGVIIGITNVKKESEKMLIVATNFPAYDFARAVAGDTADVKMLIKPGSEIHTFEPTPQDIIDIENSRMFIYTGGESDEWVSDILADINADETKTFKMMDAVKVLEEETVEGMESEAEDTEEGTEEIEYDEHVWTSVKNAIKIINSIKETLTKISPDKSAIFENNAKDYINKLEQIDHDFQAVVKNADKKTLIFADRFPLRYFVEDYGLSYYAAFPGCSEQTEASSKTIAFLVDKVKSENFKVILKNEMSSGKIADTIASETGAKVLTFNSAHNISADDFKSGVTYSEIMENNVKILEEALK